MTEVWIKYPGWDDQAEDVMRAEQVGAGRYELREHAIYIPLAPGDVVRTGVDGEVTGIEKLVPLWTYEVDFHLPANLRPFEQADPRVVTKIDALVEQWAQQGFVTHHTNFSCLASSQTRQWLDSVLQHPFVSHAELVRTPELRLDLTVAKQHADVDGRGGPWE